jgi:hypothetical protein
VSGWGDDLKDTAQEAGGDADAERDPLSDLIKRVKDDLGAPFEPEVIKVVADCADCADRADENSRKSLVEVLLRIVSATELFHAPDETPYADITVENRRETWPVKSRGFERWLVREFLNAEGGAPSKETLTSALRTIEANAHFDGPERDVFVRVGGHGGRIYLDLADKDWRVVEIDASGWRIICYADAPVRFRRARSVAPLPEPVEGGSVEELKRFVNVASEHDFILLASHMLATFRDVGPYPVLAFTGEHGAAKSTAARIVKMLTDPNSTPLRSLPRDDRDLFIAATHQRVLAFDNLSGLPNRMSDAFCRLATGGGFATRTLYENDEETVFTAGAVAAFCCRFSSASNPRTRMFTTSVMRLGWRCGGGKPARPWRRWA